MARIPEQDIEQLKNEVAVERLVEASGIVLKKSGKDKIGLCPFHEDSEASLVVSPGKNLWHCFACQIGGGPIDWVIRSRGVSFRHAVELLKADPALAAQGAVDAPVTHSARTLVRSLPPPVAFDADDQALLNQSAGYYHETLKQSPEALAYLAARGLDHPELIDTFLLGYANRTLGLRLPSKDGQTGLSIRTRLQRIGIYRESGHEHFNGSLVVPILDAAGNVTEIYGRKVRDDLRKGTPLHLYLPGPHRGIWNETGLVGAKEVILCEAIIDAMTFWCAGFTNVTASYGIEGFTEDHLNVFHRLGIKRVLIAYDRDDAGDRAADKLAGLLTRAGVECLRVLFPKGMDANSYALKLTPARQSLGLVLRQAEWMGRPAEPAPASVTPAHEPARMDAPMPAPAPVSADTPAPAHAPVQAPAPTYTQAPEPAPAADASPLAAHPAPASTETAGELLLAFDDRDAGPRRWRVRGWHKNTSPEQMRVNLQVRRETGDGGGAYHVDTLDLYAARARAAYVRQAAIELGLPDDAIKRDMGQVLLQLETLQDGAIRDHAQPKTKVAALSADDEAAALALLRAPDLVARIVADMGACGVVGEANNLLAGYLAAVSRKLDAPLAILIQSSSAAGKSSLMDAILAMVPEEERVQYSAMTGQSLFYLGENDMQHKILAIAEEEGVRQAGYALKLLQSDGELTMASTGKDEASGDLVTKQYKVKGPVMLMLTTTAIDVDEELMNRCLVLTVNESREQTRAIHERQRMKQTLAGLLAANDKTAITGLHQNAQRLLKPVLVVNPYADQLTFLDDKTRMRRDHMKYLTLIRAIALLHQHQRPVKTVEHRGQTLAYIEATRDDIALANTIAHDVLGRTLDELPPQTRRLLTLLRGWVEERSIALEMPPREFRFTRREVREATKWSDGQLKIHCTRLADMEYLLIHGGSRGHPLQYELMYDGQDDGRHLSGLIDPAHLDKETDYDKRKLGVEMRKLGQEARKSGPSQPQVTPKSGPSQGGENAGFSYEDTAYLAEIAQTHVYEINANMGGPVVAVRS
jgi:DNA primase catalytic core